MAGATPPSSNHSRERPPVRDGKEVVVFDGRGGVRRLDKAEAAQFTVPTRGLPSS